MHKHEKRILSNKLPATEFIMLRTTLFLLVMSVLQVTGQGCETYERKLFHMLPKELPDTVNCKDLNGQKQGWWLIYELQYNPVDKPDELMKGTYVESYSFGKYLDDKKIGTWRTIKNVHQIFVQRTDSFFYSPTNTTIVSGYFEGGWNEEKTTYSNDGNRLEYSYSPPDTKFPIHIICDKNLPTEKQCKMSYRNETITTFPFKSFEIEKDFIWTNYIRERKQIDSQKN